MNNKEWSILLQILFVIGGGAIIKLIFNFLNINLEYQVQIIFGIILFGIIWINNINKKRDNKILKNILEVDEKVDALWERLKKINK